MAEQELLVEVKNRVAVLTLNRPEKMNAFTPHMIASGIEALQSFVDNRDVGAILITGTGRGFCAGGDVAAMRERNEAGGEPPPLEEGINYQRRGHQLSWWIYSHPKPVLAAVNGAAAGAGLGLALACDMRIASDKARFNTAFANVGYGGDYGITWGLTHTVGPAKAKELFFLPDAIDAAEAERLGLVNRVVPHDELMTQALSIAERIAAGPAVSYRYMKANVNMAVTSDYLTMLDREAETHQRCGRTEDHQEGVRAFLEKRKPVFQGR